MSRTETMLDCGTQVVETKYDGGFTEISVYRPAVLGGRKRLMAVVSRQGRDCKWCVYGAKRSGKWLFRVKRQAVAQAVMVAKQDDPVVIVDYRKGN